MTDFLLWKNDIENRFSPTSLTDSLTGSIYIATAIISSVTTKSGVHMSQWDAYKDLRERLLNGDDTLLPQSTTTQRDALTGIVDGTLMLNITTGREEICSSSTWIGVTGSGMMSATAYGHMYENNTSGSTIDTTNKTWTTATSGVLDSNSLITFVNDAGGDYFLIGTGGAGDYVVVLDVKQTNAGNNTTTLTVQINETDTILVQDEVDSSSTKPTALAANGVLTLADADKVRLHMVSATPADVVKIYHGHFYIHRLS